MKIFTHWRLPVIGASVAALLLLGAVSVSYLAIDLNPGDQVSVHLDNVTLSSASSGAGDSFPIVAAQAFLAQGNVAIISGATGQGHVVSVTPPKNGKPAALAVQLDWITAVDGQHVALWATKKGDPLIFGAGGPFEANYSKDKPVTVGPDVVITGFVSQQRTIQINTAQ
ncbi:MAG TPA: hypothetical protein VEJ41_06295 [Candidatus Acidoferrales bacterium]|nr:hypothetical protein [Candidatus Acidoferrales bacterium]